MAELESELLAEPGEVPAEILQPFSEENCQAWSTLIQALLAPDTSFEMRMVLKFEWDRKGMAQFLRAIAALQAERRNP